MNMTYDGALVMPSKFVVVDENEMTYVEGGLQVTLTTNMLSKSRCIEYGKYIGSQMGMNDTSIAKEIYAHAVLYYASPIAYGAMLIAVGNTFIGSVAATATFNYIRSHSNPVDIGGDSATRIAVFNAIWTLF